MRSKVLIFGLVLTLSLTVSAAPRSPTAVHTAQVGDIALPSVLPVADNHTPGLTGTLTTNGTPTSVWAVHWTATKTLTKQEAYAYRQDTKSYTFATGASFLIRNYADQTNDNVDFKLRVADAAPSISLLQCDDGHGHVTGYAPTHDDYTTINPNAYDGNPSGNWDFEAYQDPTQGGQWRGFLNFIPDPGYVYTYTEHYSGSYCDGSTFDDTSYDTMEWLYTCVEPLMQGNAQGTEFTYHATGTDKDGGCEGPVSFIWGSVDPDTSNWSVDVSVKLLQARDLTVDHLEVTQGLQDTANSIPLVQGRRTVVRAFLDIGTDPGPILGVTGQLEGWVGGVKLGTVYPFNPKGWIDAPTTPDWHNIDDTLNFQLPEAWTKEPSLHLKVTVNPDHSVVESNYDNNDYSTDVNLTACNGLSIGYTPIHYAPPGQAAADPNPDIATAQGFMQKVYPLADTGLTYRPLGAMTLLQNINISPTDISLLDALGDLLDVSSAPRPDHIYGWLPSLTYAHNGRGFVPGDTAYGNDTEAPNMWRRTFAHETGHNFGLSHPPTGVLWTTEGDHWFDVYDRVIKPVPATVPGSDLLDIMVPARAEPEAWISPENYTYLFGKLCGAAAPTSAPTTTPQTGDNLFIHGTIFNTTPATGSLGQLFRLSTMPTTTLPIGSQYCLNLTNASGGALAGYCFNADFADDTDAPADAMHFSLVVPDPSGLNKIELVSAADGTVLATRSARSQPPSVTVTYPSAAGLTLSGPVTVTWVPTNPGGYTLAYQVLYSNDNGATWMGAGTHATGSSEVIDFSALPGTQGASGLIKVLVSDGFDSAEGVSANPFTVGNKAPAAFILSPSTGASFTVGPQIALIGSGVDLEDGALGDTRLSWASNKDGALGTGRVLET
ncbi:MAG TPA: hypothetical protein VMP08_19965, partial [Anaerolineae bacterium]|nr:hypothetical protein [Anaerolineae bacterium]